VSDPYLLYLANKNNTKNDYVQKHKFRQYTKKKKKERKKKREEILLEMCVGSLDHLDNCKSFGVFNIFKSMFNTYYIISLHMLIHIVNYCFREKTS
jgi:hypothetical protein